MTSKLLIGVFGVLFLCLSLGIASGLTQSSNKVQILYPTNSASIGLYNGLSFGSDIFTFLKDKEEIRKKCKLKCDDQESFCKSQCFTYPPQGGPPVEDPRCTATCIAWGAGCRNGCDIYSNHLPCNAY